MLRRAYFIRRNAGGGTIHELMFAFFSNRLGCLGSLAVSIIGSLILILAMRACSSPM